MRNYPSDISREAFEIIRGGLEKAKKTTKPGKKDLYDIFCAVLYLIKSGCQWRMPPSDFPKRGIVRYYYDVWSKDRGDGATALSGVLKKLVAMPRGENSRADKTTFGIIDARSVQNAGTAGVKGYDAGKKVSGIKRHIAADTQGLPRAVIVTAANAADRQGGGRDDSGIPGKLAAGKKVSGRRGVYG